MNRYTGLETGYKPILLLMLPKLFSASFSPFCKKLCFYFKMIGGSNKSVVLYTKDGVKLGNVGDQVSHFTAKKKLLRFLQIFKSSK